MSNAQKAHKYLLTAHAGAFLLIAVLLTSWFGAPDFIKGLTVGMLLGIVTLLFLSGMRDEYIERLWNAGTATAFLATLCSTVLLDLIQGFADQQHDVFEGPSVLSTTTVGVIALAAFFIGFHVKLLWGRA